MIYINLSAKEFIFSTTIDWNSDNKSEIVTVEVENTDNSYEFRLSIEKNEILGSYIDSYNDSDEDGIKVIDMTSDKF